MRLNFDGLAVIGQRSGNILCGQTRVAPIVIGDGKPRADLKCLIKIGDGCGEIAFAIPGYSAIAVSIGEARIEDQGRVEVSDRTVKITRRSLARLKYEAAEPEVCAAIEPASRTKSNKIENIRLMEMCLLT
jgi:hypothetical protein